MTMRRGICTNAERCRLADARAVQEIGAEDGFSCSLCGLPLLEQGGNAAGTSAGTRAPATDAPVAEAPIASRVGVPPPGAGTAVVGTPGANAAGVKAPGAGTPVAGTPGASAAGVKAPGAGTPVAGVASMAGVRTPGAGTMVAGRPGASAAGVKAPGTGTPVAASAAVIRPLGTGAKVAGPPTASAAGVRPPATGAPAASKPGATASGARPLGVRPPGAGTPGASAAGIRSPAARAPAGNAQVAQARALGEPAAAAAEAPAAASSRFPIGAAMGALVFAMMASFAFWLAWGGAPPRPAERAAVSPPPPASQPLPGGAPQIVLRLAGSNTAGMQLAPALAQGYLASLGAADVEIASPRPDEFSIQGTKDGARQAITISAHGSTTAFAALLDGTADIGLSSRRVKPDEAQRLAGLGAMTSPANEHVVALDGIAVIVSRANPIVQLSREQLSEVFGGRVSDWSRLRGQAGPIHVFAPDESSGTMDVFQALVLGRSPLSGAARRLSTNQAVADAVAGDPAGIGLVGLPFVRGVKALAVAEGNAAPTIPTAFTLANEDYFLARRLYLYTDQASKNPHASRFVEFALGPEGQAIVKKAGFVELTVKAEPRNPPEGAPVAYVRLTAGSRRLSTDFRFVAGSSRLDNRAVRDLDRVVDFLRDNDLNGASVRLMGFADGHGGAAVNLALSRERAVRVAAAFAQRGITGSTIAGFGAAIPVADNATEAGRERNRRVEIWISR